MPALRFSPLRQGKVWVACGALVFGALALGLSCWRWWGYQYGTFDLAFYVQALWLTLHGQGTTSLLGVPLLGNHAEPIVYLALPLFALWPHPMLLPLLQVLAVMTMPFTGRRIALRLGLAERPATALGLATLLAPAAGYMAIHEFHPETLAAPLLLLVYEAQAARRWGWFAAWFLLALACKENVALVLVGWCAVQGWKEWALGRAWFWRWNGAPLAVALGWLLLYGACLSPWLNGGRVDYWNLYSGLGATPREAFRHLVTEPHVLWHAVERGLLGGNLVGMTIASSAGLVLLRPRWLLLALPIFLQHLLSWRSSEWSIHYHYAAPLVPLAWLGAAEVCAQGRRWPALAWAPAVTCLLLQAVDGPGWELAGEWRQRQAVAWSRAQKAPFVEELIREPGLSVMAGLPYLSHLATRQNLTSLHLVLKGTQTLSLRAYEPGELPEAVLLDFSDAATFNRAAGYFHPAGEVEGRPLPSSEVLLQEYLGRAAWTARSLNEVTLLRRGTTRVAPEPTGEGLAIFPHTRLMAARLLAGRPGATFGLEADWRFSGPRLNIPWLRVELRKGAVRQAILLGMAAPEAAGERAQEVRWVQVPRGVPAGIYAARLVVVDEVRAVWRTQTDSVLGATELGWVMVP